MQTHKLFGFTDVDQTADASYFIRFLDIASADASFQAYKQESFRLLDVRPGQRLLEVGCGTGDDACALASLVTPGGEVVAVDSSQAMIEEAGKRASKSGLPVAFRQADALQLPFGDNEFDGCRSDRVFMHLADPRKALQEMIRVARPGAAIVVYEVDFETFVIDVPDRPLGRKILNSYCESFRDGWLGRKVPRFFQEEGLANCTVLPATLRIPYELAWQILGPVTAERACVARLISADDVRRWLDHLEQAQQAGQFFCTLQGYLVAGRKP